MIAVRLSPSTTSSLGGVGGGCSVPGPRRDELGEVADDVDAELADALGELLGTTDRVVEAVTAQGEARPGLPDQHALGEHRLHVRRVGPWQRRPVAELDVHAPQQLQPARSPARCWPAARSC